MSIRTTVTLDDDVVARLKELSIAKGVPFRTLLNEAVRTGLMTFKLSPQKKAFKVIPVDMGVPRIANLDNIAEVIESLEGESWR